jgi:predicted RNase H-like HicB family nuclease
MAEMSYTVEVTREKDAWLADVPAVAGAHTFAHSLEGLAKSVREVIILMDDLPDDAEIDLDLRFDVNDESVTEAQHLRQTREDIGRREAELISDTAHLAARLVRTYSLRDTAAMLGVTPGRVSQLVSAAKS